MIRTNQTHKNYIGTKPVMAEILSQHFILPKKAKAFCKRILQFRLFTLDEVGDLFEWKIGPPSAFRKDWKEVTGAETRLFGLSDDGLWLWVVGKEAGLKRYNTQDRTLDRDYGVIFDDSDPKYMPKVSSLGLSRDGGHLFLADGHGGMKHFTVGKGGQETLARFYEHASLWQIRKI